MAHEVKLKRGDVVRRSIAGAKGFFYPDINGRRMMVHKDCIAEHQVGWHDRDNYTAFQVPTDVFAAEDQYGPAQMMVVWVEKNG